MDNRNKNYRSWLFSNNFCDDTKNKFGNYIRKDMSHKAKNNNKYIKAIYVLRVFAGLDKSHSNLKDTTA